MNGTLKRFEAMLLEVIRRKTAKEQAMGENVKPLRGGKPLNPSWTGRYGYGPGDFHPVKEGLPDPWTEQAIPAPDPWSDPDEEQAPAAIPTLARLLRAKLEAEDAHRKSDLEFRAQAQRPTMYGPDQYEHKRRLQDLQDAVTKKPAKWVFTPECWPEFLDSHWADRLIETKALLWDGRGWMLLGLPVEFELEVDNGWRIA